MASSTTHHLSPISISHPLHHPTPSPPPSISFPLLRRRHPSLSRSTTIHHRLTATGSDNDHLTVSVGTLNDADLIQVPETVGEVDAKFPKGTGVYAVYDKSGGIQFIGLSRNVAASVAGHLKAVPELCGSVKVGLLDGAVPDRAVLTGAWKSWMEEHISATGAVPPGNETGNNTWVRRPQKKPNLRLTPGRHVQLTVPLEELIDKLVKENKVVAFIKGTRSAPQCGFSQRVVGILESQGVDFECVDVLDEEYNSGLRETLKRYSNWPTFPQLFVGGELVGGCDIISSMQEKGELTKLLQS